MATIRIAEDPHPNRKRQGSIDADSDNVIPAQSIYQMQRLTRTGTNLSDDGVVNIRARVGSRRSLSISGDIEDEDPGLRRASDFHRAAKPVGKELIWLTFQSIGVIYGDIGTSPLYVYSSTFTDNPSHQDLVGVLSLIIWSLLMMVTLKYIIIILFADNDGEGGTFSTYSLLSRYLNITNRDPREASMVQMRRHMSGDLESSGRAMRHGIEKSRFIKSALKVIGIFAVTMVLSDGVLTPAQSVLGAVQGISVVSPAISKGVVVGVTDAILVILFVIQPLGISKITFLFAPVIIIWLLSNAAFGIYNLALYDASVFKAFNPGYAFGYLIRHKEEGWRSLGGVLLSFTGVEALFADLGAFSARAVRLSWLGFCLPCLLLTYIGQAAYISVYPEAYSNPVYNACPPGTLIYALIIGILAAIVASQAIITASFQLLSQVMKLSYFPQFKVVHTSKTFHGQLYMPMANWLLMIGTIIIASVFNNTTSLGNAYGVCVMFVTFFDTTMVSLAAIFVWKIPPYYVALPWLIFALMDGTFLSSALTKVPEGAWFTLTLATVLASIFLLWRYGKEQQWSAEADDRFPTSHFVSKGSDGNLKLNPRYGGTALSSTRGLGIYFDKAGETTPIVFSNFVIKLTSIPEVMVFFHLRPLEVPSVSAEDRYSVSKLSIPNCYRVVARVGYNDEVVTPDLSAVIYEQVRKFIIERDGDVGQASAETAPVDRVSTDTQNRHHLRRRSVAQDDSAEITNTPVSSASSVKVPGGDVSYAKAQAAEEGTVVSVNSDLTLLDEAYGHKVLYIVGKEQMKIKPGTNWIRGTLLSMFLWLRDNTRNKIANLKVPTDNLIEVGFLKEI
ncbi:hypothetical protein MBLNU457_7015t2 [Dothideomycetes sp. NU457]